MFESAQVTILFFFYILLGIGVGSFLNAWMWRSKKGTSILKGRSACVHCSYTLTFRDLVPIFSYIVLKGKCRKCKKQIPSKYPVVEAVTGLMFALTALAFDPNLSGPILQMWGYFLALLVVTVLLIFTFFYDYEYGEILDRTSLIPAGIWFALAWGMGWMGPVDMLWGVLIAGGFFLTQFVVSKGKWIGGGDVRFGVFMGVLLGWQGTLLALFLAYIMGAIVGSIMMAAKKTKMTSTIPFGTFLAIATWIAIFYGEEMISWYVGLM